MQALTLVHVLAAIVADTLSSLQQCEFYEVLPGSDLVAAGFLDFCAIVYTSYNE